MALGKLFQERIASSNSPIMHFLGQLVLALAIVAAAMIVAFAFRFTPVTERSFGFDGKATGDYTHSFDHWTGK